LCEYREESKYNKEAAAALEQMNEKWKTFVEFNAYKYPDTLKHAASLSNHAVIMNEFYKRDISKFSLCHDHLKLSTDIISKMVSPKIIESKLVKEDLSTEISYIFSDDTQPDENQCAVYIVLLQNYITYLRKSDDRVALSRNSNLFIQISMLAGMLGEKESENLSLERMIAGVHVMPISPSTFKAEFKYLISILLS